jgi:anaerobic selenocysteine-containing dehydrogenase
MTRLSEAIGKTNMKVPGEDTGIEVRKTICDICNPFTHCGIDAYVKNGVVVKVEGTKNHPHSQGTLCAKGSANRQYIYHTDRIRTRPRKGKRGSGDLSRSPGMKR